MSDMDKERLTAKEANYSEHDDGRRNISPVISDPYIHKDMGSAEELSAEEKAVEDAEAREDGHDKPAAAETAGNDPS